MRSQAWFDAYEEAFDALVDTDCPASLVSEAAAELANATVTARLLDRADALRDRMKEER